jgi:hypothetical protein
VAATVLGIGGAAPVAEKTSQGVVRARHKRLAQHIQCLHGDGLRVEENSRSALGGKAQIISYENLHFDLPKNSKRTTEIDLHHICDLLSRFHNIKYFSRFRILPSLG